VLTAKCNATEMLNLKPKKRQFVTLEFNTKHIALSPHGLGVFFHWAPAFLLSPEMAVFLERPPALQLSKVSTQQFCYHQPVLKTACDA